MMVEAGGRTMGRADWDAASVCAALPGGGGDYSERADWGGAFRAGVELRRGDAAARGRMARRFPESIGICTWGLRLRFINRQRFQGTFRRFYDYAGGFITDFGAARVSTRCIR